MMGNIPDVMNFNQLFIKLNWFIGNKQQFSPFIDLKQG